MIWHRVALSRQHGCSPSGSCALHFCQKIVESCVEDVIGADRMVKDREKVVVLGPPGQGPRGTADGPFNDVAGAAYVDNIAILAASPRRADTVMQLVIARLTGLG